MMANLHNGNFMNLYSSRAHVFQINPETRNSWLQKVEQAIPISLVATLVDEQSPNELTIKELKIIGTGENGGTVLDAVILPTTVFTKRSPKFGQWIDHTNAVYGLGFNSETELTDFVKKFEQIQKDRLLPPSHHQQSQQDHSASNSNFQPQTGLQGDRQAWNQQLGSNITATHGETNGRYQLGKNSIGNMQQYSNTLAHPGHQQQQSRRSQQQSMNNTINVDANGNNDVVSNNNGAEPVAGTSSSYQRSQSMLGFQSKTNNTIDRNSSPEERNLPATNNESQMQLKYENERLKEALEESAKNAGSWHNELQNLRTNNAKLTQALQESKAHVKEWERELLGLRDENNELKLRLLSLESSHDPERGNESKRDLIQKYSDELKRKEKKIEELKRELELRDQTLEQEGQLDGLNSNQFLLQPQCKQKLETVVAKLESKVRGFIELQRELESIIESV